jgi:hypothetical protein
MRFLALFLAGLSHTSLAQAQPAKQPTADEVLARFVQVSGGEEAFRRINTVVMKGALEIKAQGIKADILVYRADGGKSYSVTDIPGMGKQEEGSNGEVVWEKTALGPRLKSGVEKFLLTCAGEAASEYARAIAGKDTCYDKIEFAGDDTVEGKPAWKLKLTPKMGKIEEQFFDKNTGLLIQQKMTMPSPLGELPITLIIGGYKKIDGLETPTSVSTKLGPVDMQASFSSVTYNEKIPDQIFAIPPDIAALVAAEKKTAKP